MSPCPGCWSPWWRAARCSAARWQASLRPGRRPWRASRLVDEYETPSLAHATREPMNCTAHVRADGVDIWAPTQFQTGAHQMGAAVGGVAPPDGPGPTHPPGGGG